MNAHSNAVIRLVPDEPFPSYAYVPGLFPHPTSDPAGHSYQSEPPIPEKFEPEDWRDCRPYLYGIDLFNAGFYWESHVAWESLWIACGRKGVTAVFLKGLIKLAAAGVKNLEQRPAGVKSPGVKSHSGRAVELLRRCVQTTDHLMGFKTSDLLAVAELINQQGWPSPPPILLPTQRSAPTKSALE